MIFAFSYALARGTAALKWSLLTRQMILLAWVILAVYASLKLLLFPEVPLNLPTLLEMPFRFLVTTNVEDGSFLHLILLILLVWRGIALARSPLSLFNVQASFQLGLVFLLLYGMAFAPLFPIEATLGLYVYLFCGLLAMSTVRIANLSETRGGRIPRFGLSWMMGIILAALTLVGLAILAGWLGGGQVVELLARIVIILFAILTALILLILSPLLLSLAQFLPALSEFFQQLLARLKNLPFAQQVANIINQLNEGLGKVFPYMLAFRAVIIIGLLLGLLLIVLVALQMRSRNITLTEEEESENASNLENERLLQRLLHHLWRDMRGLRQHTPAQLLAAARVRQIYRQLMALAQKLGAERPPSVTPLEFLPQLEQALPDTQKDVDLITAAYLKVRYGEYPETRQEISAVEAAWVQVRQHGKQQVSLQKRMKKGV